MVFWNPSAQIPTLEEINRITRARYGYVFFPDNNTFFFIFFFIKAPRVQAHVQHD